MQKVDPVGSNITLQSVFSGTFIEPEVVKAYEAVLQTDYHFLTSLSKMDQAYIFGILSFLAPNDDARLPNFGRSMIRKERKNQSKRNIGWGGKSAGRLSKPKVATKNIISTVLLTKVFYIL